MSKISGVLRLKKTRVILESLLSLMTAIASAFILNENKICIWAIIVTGVGVIGSVVYSLFLVGIDQNKDKAVNRAEKDMEQYQLLFGGVSKEMIEDAEGINHIAKQIQKNGKLDEYRWTLDTRAKIICGLIKKYLSKLNIQENDIVVNYTIKIDANKIKTIGCDKALNETLKIYQKERDINAPDAYFDAKMFRNGESEPVFRLCAAEVDKILVYENREKEAGKYEQCLFIPVMCDENKMVGNLEVLSRTDVIIAENEGEMKKLIVKLKIFTSLLLLLQKAEKAATSIPINKEVKLT